MAQGECVGSDRQAVTQAITTAARTPRGNVSLQVVPNGQNALTCDMTITDLPPVNHAGAEIVVVVTEDGLTVDVKRGENGGRTLRHSGVVRSLETVTVLKPSQTKYAGRTQIRLDGSWDRKHLRVIAFVRQRDTLSIIAAGGAQP